MDNKRILTDWLEANAMLLSQTEKQGEMTVAAILLIVAGAIEAGSLDNLANVMGRFTQAEIGRLTN